ncbi:hypothetical protein DSM3645_26879 [Blastopirellula marina DSM 3645]|uniref:Uncharacterized protein n=1 Tax=Blastopirellula marina DSM 3645 TaxID=314230 RepID=A3ZYA1_9BACT|nr:hypothetical protein DSM3645_26879 [Blastopirellula marina DSM 3645]
MCRNDGPAHALANRRDVVDRIGRDGVLA